MSGRQAPLFLAAGVVSAMLLLALVLMLSRPDGAAEASRQAAPLQAQAEVKFPAGFGRLDELVPFAGGVAPVATEVAPVEHGTEYRDAAWVSAQDAETFTIQVLAARDESAVKRFLAERDDRARFVYFLFPQGNANWFVVTTGSYPSHELAAGIIESEDFGSLPARPFPRRMGIYLEALKAPLPAPES